LLDTANANKSDVLARKKITLALIDFKNTRLVPSQMAKARTKAGVAHSGHLVTFMNDKGWVALNSRLVYGINYQAIIFPVFWLSVHIFVN